MESKYDLEGSGHLNLNPGSIMTPLTKAENLGGIGFGGLWKNGWTK